MTDTRCSDCQEIGCECPLGYLTSEIECELCKHVFVLRLARCSTFGCCPKCDHSIDVE